MSSRQRRSFLQLAAAMPAWTAGAGLAGLSSRVWAGPVTDTRFLLVFLRGGYDAMSLLVPASSSFYKETRPNIAVPLASAGQTAGATRLNSPGQTAGATRLNSDWALHPAMDNSLLPLVQTGQARFIPFAGIDDPSRSHFETQDAIELGQQRGASRDFGSGFMNRLAMQLGARNAIAFSSQMPTCLRGQMAVANVSLKAAPPSARGGAAPLQEALKAMYQDTPLQARVAESFEVRSQVAQEMSAMTGEMEAANRGAITAKGFELEARRIARLMRERYALGFVDVGGWDTHINQGAGTGYLASRFEELGTGLAAFAAEIGPATWRKTTVVVVSEFGRTARENGNRGTDHGHGSVYWVLGGGLSAEQGVGPVVGEQVRIEASTLNQNRDLPVLNDYRSVLGGLFARQYGLSAKAIDSIFPGAKPQDLRLL